MITWLKYARKSYINFDDYKIMTDHLSISDQDSLANDAQSNASQHDDIVPEGDDTLAQTQNPSVVVRTAKSAAEIEAVQRLRYHIFYEENGAHPSAENKSQGLDFDKYDDIADHLIVVDKSIDDGPKGIVGTYRLIRQEMAEKHGGFYTSGEFDISSLTQNNQNTLELGRSCVMKAYRTKPVIQKLWAGISTYVTEHDVTMLFGCASIPGTNIDDISEQLAYLYHHHLAPDEIRACALDERYVNMNLHPKDSLDAKRIFASLPPLFRGYLRIGSFVGDGAVIDHDFNTTDVCMILSTKFITDRYRKHYERLNNAPIPSKSSES